MKRRVLNHKNRCEVLQYVKLMKKLDKFEWTFGDIEDSVTFSEYTRRYKKLVNHTYGKKFRSYRKAMKYDDLCWINHRNDNIGD